MSNAERAAIALWCMKNGFYPRGNTNYGKSHEAGYETASPATYGSNNRVNCTLTGTGPQSWNHDNTPFGISDFGGNIWEWCDGMRLVNGQILLVGEDSTPMNNFDTQNTQNNNTGWIQTGVYYDGSAAGDSTPTDHKSSSQAAINDHREYPSYTVEDTNAYYAYILQGFKTLEPVSGYTPPTYLKQLALQPVNPDVPCSIRCRNYGERTLLVGGHWDDSSTAGVFAMNLNFHRSEVRTYRGLRTAFISL